MSDLVRFFSKTLPQRAKDSCLVWVGMRYRNGYGRFSVGNQHIRAHRWVYERVHGPIAEGLELDHMCGNRACVNVGHLVARTKAEHRRRHHKNDAVCRNGHPRTDANTYIFRGFNMCRECRNEWMKSNYRPKVH